jgi:DNA-binding MarR family transcriptional regulator
MLTIMGRDIIDELQQDWEEQRPDLDSEPMGVVLRIQALAKVLGDQAEQRLGPFDLQWWQYDVLATLRRQGEPYEMAATELAEAAMLTSGAMTNRIDRLEQAGLIRRIDDPADRRRVIVRLTGPGLRVIEDAAEARFASATEALKSLSASQRRQLSDLLRLVLSAQNG